MAPQPTDRFARRRFAFLRRHRLAVVAVAAPLAVLLVATVTVAAPSNRTAPKRPTEQTTAFEDPNYRRVSLASPGAVFDFLGEPDPISTEPLTGEVDLARLPGEVAMTTENLVLKLRNGAGVLGEVSVAIRPENLTEYEYNPASQSIVFATGLEFAVGSVPGTAGEGEPVYLYTEPIRLLPTEVVEPPVFPPFEQTFSLPAAVALWEGENGVTGSEAIGMMTAFELTVTHPG